MMRDTTIDTRSMGFTPPMCGICLKRCERLLEEYDAFMQRVVYTAVCHGERERVVITEDEMNQVSVQLHMAMGTAFLAPLALPQQTGET